MNRNGGVFSARKCSAAAGEAPLIEEGLGGPVAVEVLCSGNKF